jgi:aminotransferase EvaB
MGDASKLPEPIMKRLVATSYELRLPVLQDGSHVAHLYVMCLPDRDRFREKLTALGVGNDVHYPLPDYAQKSVRQQLGGHPSLTITEEACRQVVTLPCFPELTDGEVEKVITSVRAAFQK